MGQKTTDFSAIPLCAAHHREHPDSYHRLGEQGFPANMGLPCKNSCGPCEVDSGSKTRSHPALFIRWRWRATTVQKGKHLLRRRAPILWNLGHCLGPQAIIGEYRRRL